MCLSSSLEEKSNSSTILLHSWGKQQHPCSPDTFQTHYILVCKSSACILNQSMLLDNLKSQLIYQRFSIGKCVKNDQKIHLKFYPEFLLQDVSFLPYDSTQHQIHIHQDWNHLFNWPTHCQTTVTAKGFNMRLHFSSYWLCHLKFPTDSTLHKKLVLSLKIYLDPMSKRGNF
jgi:hypothetical protein